MRIPSATPRPGVHARTWLRTAAVAVAVVGSAAVVAGCQAPFSAPPTVSVAADFSDVGDLAVGAPVELADIPVGHVTSITLQVHDDPAGDHPPPPHVWAGTAALAPPPGRPQTTRSSSTWSW